MITLDFEEMVVANFKSFGSKPQTFVFDREVGLHFLQGENLVEPRLGPNGAGKSAIGGALTWCLYGRTVDGLRNPDVRPWNGKDTTSISVQVKVNNRRKKITRTASPNKLLIDDKEVGEADVENLIGMGLPVFRHTVLFGQAQPLFLDLKPEPKLQLLSETLNLDRWEKRSELTAKKAVVLQQDLANAEGEIVGLEGALSNTQTLMKNARRSADEWDEERRKLLKEADKKLKEWTSRLDKLKNKQATADLTLDGAVTELKPLDKEMERLQDDILTAQTDEREHKTTAQFNEREWNRLSAELKSLDEDSECPLCKQKVRRSNIAGHKVELEKKLSTLKKQLENWNPKKDRQKVEALVAKLNATREQAREFKARAEEARDALTNINADVSELEAQIKTLRDTKAASLDEANPFREQLQTLRKQEKTTIAKLEDLDDEVAQLQGRVERTKFWVKGFKDVRLYLIEELLQELEIAANSMLPESGLDSWEIKFDVEKETKSGSTQRGLNVTVLSPSNSGPVKWESWSGGEGQRLRVVGALALAEVLLEHAGVRCNLEMLDEPTRGLSPNGVRDLVEYLAYRAEQQDKTIYYIDHTTIQSKNFRSVVKITKTEKGSVIE